MYNNEIDRRDSKTVHERATYGKSKSTIKFFEYVDSTTVDLLRTSFITVLLIKNTGSQFTFPTFHFRVASTEVEFTNTDIRYTHKEHVAREM